MIVAQVQLSQMGGVDAKSRGQAGTALLCDETAWQPVNNNAAMLCIVLTIYGITYYYPSGLQLTTILIVD